jgi:formylmethanofuran dehydrogenase subunit B
LSRAEIEQAADLVLFIGAEPDAAQPRFRERHLRRGLGDQRRIVFLTQPALAEVVALRVHWEKDDPLPDALAPLAAAIHSARCVQVYFDPTLAASEPELVDQWQMLAAQQRRHCRFGVALLGTSGLARTATEALTWLTGYPGPLDFTHHKPRYRPGIGEAQSLLDRNAFDAIMWIGLDPRRPSDSYPRPRAVVPEIQIGSPASSAHVAFQVPGLNPRIDAHVVREDGVLLRLPGANQAVPDPTTRLLNQILAALPEANA